MLLKGEFTEDDLKKIADLMRQIDTEHGGASPFFMLLSAPNVNVEEGEKIIKNIFPALDGVPFEIGRFKKDGTWSTEEDVN